VKPVSAVHAGTTQCRRSLLEATTRIAIELNHPAYDCLYVALAVERDCRFVIADDHFLT
jgi:predicted nucleic acid-binding protein